MKRATSVLLSIIMLFLCAFPVLAETPQGTETAQEGLIIFNGPEPQHYESAETTALANVSVNYTALATYLAEQIATCPNEIDISQFHIPCANFQDLFKYIWYYIPECFNFINAQCAAESMDSDILFITNIEYYSFADTAAEYQEAWTGISNAANAMTADLVSNTALSDVEKALLLHDRLAVWNEYEITMSLESDYSIYGALALRTSVCEGYAKAYIYLLSLVGIEADFCSSQELAHAWNIVYINDTPYHVDVTYDDPPYDVSGQVMHDYFLVSTNKLNETRGATATDFDTTPSDTTYDNYFWRNYNITAAVQLIGNDIYCVNMSTAKLGILDVNNNSMSNLLTISNKWMMDGTQYYIGCFTKLASDGTTLFYSTPSTVYAYDTQTGGSTEVFTPVMDGDYYWIYGLDYQDGYIICDTSNTPIFESDTKAAHQKTLQYPPEQPYNCSVSGHKWNDGTVTTEPTCTTEGLMLYTCTECGETKNGSIPVSDHTYERVTNPATVTADGSVVEKCSECGAVGQTIAVIPKASNVSISASSFVFTNGVLKPIVSVKNSRGKDISTDYYDINWSDANSKALGTYFVVINFKGNYSGTCTYAYTIVPRQVTGLKTTLVSRGFIDLTWDKLAEAKCYKVQQSSDGKNWTIVATVTTNSARIEHLKTASSYQFRVLALDKDQTVVSKPSAVLKTGTLTGFTRITSITSQKAGQVTLKWNKVPGAATYIVCIFNNNKWSMVKTGVTGTTCTLTNLIPGRKYYFRVVAVNPYGGRSVSSPCQSVVVKK